MRSMSDFRIGFGYDSHRFDAGRRLVLGGVEIPFEFGLAGHSDADAVLHAVMDAMLGAAAMGDIGSHFPNDDDSWKDADSADMTAVVVEEVERAGWRVGNVDVTVVCERPRLRPHVNAIRERVAELLNVDAGCVSVKGKTNEKMDDVGAGTGIEVYAVCMLKRKGG